MSKYSRRHGFRSIRKDIVDNPENLIREDFDPTLGRSKTTDVLRENQLRKHASEKDSKIKY